MDKPSLITELLQRSGFPADDVLHRGKFLHRLNRLVSSLLGDDLRLHCQVGNVRDGVLILYVDSTAWASRLRYQAPVLLKQLQQRKGLEALSQVEVKVLPPREDSKVTKRAELSKEASACLQGCADAIEDEELSNALRRLASHHKEG